VLTLSFLIIRVYRAYDSRPCLRSSSVYGIVSSPLHLIHEVDGRTADLSVKSKDIAFSTLGGKLKVIAVPFVERPHYPSEQNSFAVAKYLKKILCCRVVRKTYGIQQVPTETRRVFRDTRKSEQRSDCPVGDGGQLNTKGHNMTDNKQYNTDTVSAVNLVPSR
jgi:hypothetical protein